jgi:hypothetical protein
VGRGRAAVRAHPPAGAARARGRGARAGDHPLAAGAGLPAGAGRASRRGRSAAATGP